MSVLSFVVTLYFPNWRPSKYHPFLDRRRRVWRSLPAGDGIGTSLKDRGRRRNCPGERAASDKAIGHAGRDHHHIGVIETPAAEQKLLRKQLRRSQCHSFLPTHEYT